MDAEDRIAQLEARVAAVEHVAGRRADNEPGPAVARARNAWGFRNPLLYPRESIPHTSIADRTRSIWIPAATFFAVAGAPTLGEPAGNNDNYFGWLLDDASTESVLAMTGLPTDFAYGRQKGLRINAKPNSTEVPRRSILIYGYFVNTTINAGNYVVSCTGKLIDSVGVGGDASAAHDTYTAAGVVSADSQHLITEMTLATQIGAMPTSAITLPDGTSQEILSLKISRTGGHASDTLTGDVCFLGATLIYAADS